MIGHVSSVKRSARQSMYRSPTKRNKRHLIPRNKPEKRYKKTKVNKFQQKGFKGSYQFKLYSYPNMKYIQEREKNISKFSRLKHENL